MRRVNAKAWNLLVRVLFYVPVRDIDCAFKLFRREVFDGVHLESVGAMVNTELMVKVGRSGYSVVELQVREGDWLANRTLAELSLRDEGIAVPAITRGDGSYHGTATGAAAVRPGDVLVLYGRLERLCELDRRRAGVAGDTAHLRGVEAQERALAVDRRAVSRRASVPDDPSAA